MGNEGGVSFGGLDFTSLLFEKWGRYQPGFARQQIDTRSWPFKFDRDVHLQFGDVDGFPFVVTAGLAMTEIEKDRRVGFGYHS